MGKRQRYWAVLQTKQVSSRDARVHVARQDFEILHLMYRARPEHGVRRILPLFPYYLLVRLNVRRDNWRVLHSTRGVRSMFMSGDLPSRVPDETVQFFRDAENEMGYTELAEHEPPQFNRHELVTGMNGLFAGCTGEYQGLAGATHERVRVLFRFLGVPKVVEMKAYDLVAA